MATHELTIRADIQQDDSAKQTNVLRENIHTLQAFTAGGRSSVAVVRNLNRILSGNLQSGLLGLTGTFGRLAGPAAALAVSFTAVAKSINNYMDAMAKAQQEWRELGRSQRDRRIERRYSNILAGNITQEDAQAAQTRIGGRQAQIQALETSLDQLGKKIESQQNNLTGAGWAKNLWARMTGGETQQEKVDALKKQYELQLDQVNRLNKMDELDRRIMQKWKEPKTEKRGKNWLDSMSRQGLYMSSGMAQMGGFTEIEVLKQQTKLLEKIESNTRDSSVEAVYT